VRKPTKWWFGIVSALLISGGVALCFWTRLPPEPVYQGRTLSEWLADCNYSDSPQDKAAKEAIAKMGTNVLPHLEPMLRSHDSRLKLWAINLVRRQRLVRMKFISAEERQQSASRACRAVGNAAAIYLPELVSMLDHTNSLTTPWCGLVAIADVSHGVDCVPELTKALTNHFAQVRWHSAYQLSLRGTNAQSAIPILISCLEDSDSQVRRESIRCLGRIGSNAPTVIPALVRCLSSHDRITRKEAAMAVGEFGTNARIAETALQGCLEDEDKQVRDSAEYTLRRLRRAKN